MAGGRSVSSLGLPQAEEKYSQAAFQALLDYIRILEESVYKRNTHLEVWSPPDSGGRQPLLILRSPDGATRYSIQVDAGGQVVAVTAGTTGMSL